MYRENQVSHYYSPAGRVTLITYILFAIIIFIECVTLGVCLSWAIYHSVGIYEYPQRTGYASLLWAGFCGYCVTIPCIFIALYILSPVWLIPYMIWRVLAIGLTIAIGGVMGVLIRKQGSEAGDFPRMVPAVVIECVLGVVLLVFAIVLFIILYRNQKRSRVDSSPALARYHATSILPAHMSRDDRKHLHLHDSLNIQTNSPGSTKNQTL